MVFARSVHKRFGQVEVLRGIDLDVPRGSVTALVGPSGSGKSTLLRCINHLDQISAGTLMVDGAFVGYDFRNGRLYETSERQLGLRRAEIGMVFQSFNLFAHLTALANLTEAPVGVRGVPHAQARAEALDLLDQVGLADKADAYPHELSGGQQQRVAIARALAMKPKLLLFDEPTSALDPELVGEVLKVIRALAATGMTMVIVTHEIGFARDVADQLVFMENGIIVERGKPGEMIGNPQSPRTRNFLSRVL